MIKRILSLSISIFTLVGCSAHAPSASKFMNEKNNAGNLGIGISKALGDNYTHRVDDEGNSDGHHDYTEFSYILDAVLSLRFYNTHFGMGLTEDFLLRLDAGYSNDYFGIMVWGIPYVVDDDAKLLKPFGATLIQQYPINSEFKVGISEYFSNNSYADVYSDDCCTLDTDNYSLFYKEIGTGIYLTYKNFSFEFRYGNELNSSNQRFYLDINAMFGFPINDNKNAESHKN